MAKNLMIQGTMSNAGKSLVVAGILRVLKQEGYKVAPFKSQNMALNSFITEEGLEMGRAQVMQAEAAGISPSVLMNPILLKPTCEVASQVIVNGEVVKNMNAKEYYKMKKGLIPEIKKAYDTLDMEYDFIIIEGAGSPAEINLRKDDIVNMGMAELVDAPVLLVGDIDRGGVFAQLVGTIMLLEKSEKERVKGLIINKFRGDKTILQPGIEMLYDRCKIPITGVLPYMQLDIDDEDSLTERFRLKRKAASVRIMVIKLPHISNFTDFNPLERCDGVSLEYVSKARDLENADMVILPGTKNTMGDLLWMRQNGIEAMIKKVHQAGKIIFGICGGYQMLGEMIYDPENAEHGGSLSGIGLLRVETVFKTEKRRTRVSGRIHMREKEFCELNGATFEGYEIHMGETRKKEVSHSFSNISFLNSEEVWEDGCVDKNVMGTYIHGIFEGVEVRNGLVKMLYRKKGLTFSPETQDSNKEYKEKQYDLLADMIREHMDLKQIYRILNI